MGLVPEFRPVAGRWCEPANTWHPISLILEMVKFGANPSMRFVPCLTGLLNVAIHDIQGFGLVPDDPPVRGCLSSRQWGGIQNGFLGKGGRQPPASPYTTGGAPWWRCLPFATSG